MTAARNGGRARAYSVQLGRLSDDPTRSAMFAYVLACGLADAGDNMTAPQILTAIETALVHAQQDTDLVDQLRAHHYVAATYVHETTTDGN